MSFTLEVEHPFGADRTIRRYAAPNGLKLVLMIDRSAPIFSYQTWFKVGSRHEAVGSTGIAHLFEHLMFNQTESMGPGELDRLIERAGGDTNAATWTDWTFYRNSLPSRDLEIAVRLEADRMQNLVLDSGPLESEREVVINERMERVEDDVDGFLSEQLFKLAFETHAYGWPTIGWMNDIRGLSEAKVRRFYRTFYAPNNATIVVIGDVQEQRALDLVDSYYGSIPAAVIPSETTAQEPDQTSARRAVFRKPVSADRVMLGYKTPGQADPDWPVLELIDTLLTGGPSARLYRELVVDREAATIVDGMVFPFRDPSLYEIAVTMTRGHSAHEAIAAVDAATRALTDVPVPEAELAKVKNCVETDFWSSLVSIDSIAESLGHYETTFGDFRSLFDMAERIANVSAADIQRVAAMWLRSASRTTVVAEPETES